MQASSIAELIPLRLVSKAVELQWRVMLLPWTTFLYWLSCFATVLMRFLILTGSPPAEFYSKAKIKEIMNVVEHLHQREDAYRRKIKELQEEIEVQSRDRKRALGKLAKLRAERSAAMAEESGGGVGIGSSPFAAAGASGQGGARLRWGMHCSVLLVSLAALAFYDRGGASALSRKIVNCIIFPTWFGWVYALSPHAPRSFASGLYCSSWFLMGFLFHQWTKLS